MTIEEKEEFLIKLSKKPKDFGKVITRLMRERELLRLEIEQLIFDSYNADEALSLISQEVLHREHYKGIGQVDIHLDFDLDCDKSPYGLHALPNGHQHHNHCAWCEKQISGF